MILDESEYLAHYGILRKSGRYPWGSGGTQEIRNKMFLDYVADLRKQGLTDKEIAQGVGMRSSTELRELKTIVKNAEKQREIGMAQKLRAKGMSNTAIAERMGRNESYVRSLLKPGEDEKAQVLTSTANMLRDQVAEKKYVDVGSGVEQQLNITETKMKAALAILKEDGYNVYPFSIPQLGTATNKTNFKVLCAPGVTYGQARKDVGQIQQIFDRKTDDGGLTWFGIHPPLPIESGRVGIRYAEQGGSNADGVIYVRPGVPDVSLGGKNYAQVRIQVGDGHYLKGMAMYKTDLPDGVDLVFNTNKSDTGNKYDAMKPLKEDKDNPFGAQISRQITTKDANGKDKVTSVMNIVNEEGDWHEWSRTLSSQMLSKQKPELAKHQLDVRYESRLREYEEIVSMTNPAVKKKLLLEFAEACDSSAGHLEAASLPNQTNSVILPIESMKPSEIYAPNYENGTRVVLIRHPHGGTFEIPELTVNNRHPEAKALLGNARDAVGIHHEVAQRLSGADFDGDTVVVIPNNSKRVTVTPALEKLKNFEPRVEYKGYEGMPKMSARKKQAEMGNISNLITDMTIKNAPVDEIARAVKHSMVVIDAEKHDLDWRRSAADNGIQSLKLKYQYNPGEGTGRSRLGASTLISRANSEKRVPQRKDRPQSQGGPIDPETGKKVYVETGETYVNRNGKLVKSETKTTKLADTEDAHTLSSGTPMERLYADHSNRLKTLANRARKDAVGTPNIVYSKSANETYAQEVSALNARLYIAKQNRPYERQAQAIANATYRAKLHEKPDMDEAERKKVKAQALNAARIRTGAKKELIRFTPREWEAVQAGAIHHTTLVDILANADIDSVRDMATPRKQLLMSPTMSKRAQDMLNLGATRAEVAAQLGVSLATLDTATDVKGVD